MKILIVAYEFPPSPSPQSLRWMYLSRELARLGHEVHVLTADIASHGGALAVPDNVTVHRSWAGPVRGLVAMLAKRKQARMELAPASVRVDEPAPAAATPSGLNWKGRLVERVQKVAEHVVFPDLRGEWKWGARRRMRELLRALGPDVVISSHEPATTLELGLHASRSGYRWVADLGDPVLAAYTPRRWKRRANRIEAATCRRVDLLLVTNQGARQLMVKRHGIDEKRVHVVTQGFESRPAPKAGRARDGNRVEALYTGSFYMFRQPDQLLAAVLATPQVRLSIAAIQVPDVVREYAARFPDTIRLLGFLPHERVLELQQESDLLVSIGNEDPAQIPGKFFEYLGAGRPILHISQHVADDEAASILRDTGRGWVTENGEAAIASALATIVASNALRDGADEASSPILQYSWDRIAGRLDRLLFPDPEPRPASSAG